MSPDIPISHISTPDMLPLSDRQAYLQSITSMSIARALEVGASLTLEKRDFLKTQIINYANGLDERVEIIEEETTDERTQRLGWMTQAATIELLGNYELRASPIRAAWKRSLAMEILKARQKNNPPSLLGIEVVFQEPHQGYLDEFSMNRVIIQFTNQQGLTRAPLPLHVGSNIRSLYKEAGIEISELTSLIENHTPAARNHELIFFLMAEIHDLLASLEKKPELNINYNAIHKRFKLFEDLIRDPEIKKIITVSYREVQENNKRYYHLIVKIMEANGRLFREGLNFQPEEVNDNFWDLLRQISNHPNIPSRDACLAQIIEKPKPIHRPTRVRGFNYRRNNKNWHNHKDLFDDSEYNSDN